LADDAENATNEQRSLLVSRVLVTGANGFVGQALCCALSEQHEVIASMRQETSFPSGVTRNVNPAIDSTTDWGSCLGGVNVVIHLAAHVHAHDEFCTQSDIFNRVNLDSTVNLARQAALAGVERFIYLSTVKVHGENTASRAFTEEDEPRPRGAYALSKLSAEQALAEIGRETGMAIVIIRSPLVYGPGVRANFYQLLELVQRIRFLPFAAIRNRRSMIFLGNLVDSLALCVAHPGAGNRTYLVSDGEDVSTPQLVQRLAKAMHYPVFLFALPLSWMKAAAWLLGKSSAIDRLTQSLAVDSTKIRNELGWQAPYTLHQGLQITVDWYLRSKQAIIPSS
jgi:nucleoside-diphosphate-sugar epimerase